MNKEIPFQIQDAIQTLRNTQVMLDRDLAKIYGIETKVLNQAVKRNIRRFPTKFMFQLTIDELRDWKSQNVTSNGDKWVGENNLLPLLNMGLLCCQLF